MAIDFRLLGEVVAYSDGRVVDVGHARQRCVLAVLLLDVNRPVPVDHLLDRVWADRLPQRARATLSSYLSRLRRLFHGVAGVGVVRQSGGYLLAADPLTVDLHRFRHLVSRARAENDSHEAAELFERALALWRGEALAGLDTPWLNTVREGLHAERLAAELERNDVALALGRHADLLGDLSARSIAHPLDERLAAQLMLALYRCGRQADALQRYEQLRRQLAEELGADPSRSLQQLHQQILTAEPALTAAARQPEQTVPRQLPAPPRCFAGRVDELSRLQALLTSAREAPAAMAVCVVSGTAGVGKTALAVHWAHQVLDRFPDGQLYVNLRGYAPAAPMRPIEALTGFLRALGAAPEQIPADPQQAAALYRTMAAGRQLLVVLDNARSAEQVRPLLPGDFGCMVLVTSRDALGGLIVHEGASHLTLGTLAPPEAHQLLSGIVGQRVREQPQASAQLAERCAFLPLALRIAAANLALRPQRAVADLVADLAGGDPLTSLCTAGDEQAAVRAAFDLSYHSLDPAARRLFRLLGLLPGHDVTAGAAAALMDADAQHVARLLNRLADAHLLDQDANARFAFHDLLRLYAVERTRAEDSAEEANAAIERVCAWYLAGASAAADLLYPNMLRLPRKSTSDTTATFAGHAPALAWLEAERQNLVAAIQEFAGVAAAPICQLADILRGYFQLRRYIGDWLTVAHAALMGAGAVGDLRAQAAAQTSLGTAHRSVGDHKQALRHYAQALRLSRSSAWQECEAVNLGNLGIACQYLGLLKPAARLLHRALAIDRAIGRHAGETNNLGNLANVEHQMGLLDAAAQHFTEAAQRNRHTGNRHGEALSLTGLGEVNHRLGRLDLARSCLSQAMRLYTVIGDRDGQAVVLFCLSALDCASCRPQDAARLALEALASARETGDRRTEAAALNALAAAHLALGADQPAADCYGQALDLARQTATRLREIDALLGLAASQRRLGDLDKAMSYARQALALARSGGYLIHEDQALAHLSGAGSPVATTAQPA